MKKKIQLMLLLLPLLTATAFSQSPNWLWATSAAGTFDDLGHSIAVDGSGSSYVIGIFESSSITFGTTTLTNANAGDQDIFIVKYDAGGNVVWAKSAGGSAGEWGLDIAVDGSGSSFVTGFFYSSSITFGTTTLINAGYRDIFIVKYDAGGNVVWAKSAGGSFDDEGFGIAIDGSGNSYVTGHFNSPSITFGTTTLTNAGSNDFLLVKYDAGGNVVWAKSAVGSSWDHGHSIAVDGSGSSYVTGWFLSSSITFGTTTLTNAGIDDIFIVKYDAGGNVVWAKSAGGSGYDNNNSIAIDGSGSSYVTGIFESSSITFGTTTLTNANAGDQDIFIVKYDAGGNVVWAKSAGGSSDDESNGIAVDGSGSSYVTGHFNSPSITFGTTILINAGSNDIFIVKYDAGGNVVWAKSAGGSSADEGYIIAVDGSGSSYVTGFFQSPSITFGTTTLTNGGNSDMFVARLAGTITSVEEAEGGAGVSVFPNPLSNSTTISFSLPQSQKVSLKIFDVNGRLVSTLADKIFEAGENELTWNAADVNAGIYFLQMETEIYSENRKLIVAK